MNVFLKIIVGFLLFFTPFAFAGAEPWGFAVLQGGIVLCWILLLFSRHRLLFPSTLRPVLFTLGFLILLTFIQTFFYRTLLDPVAAYPVTLMPLYSWEHISFFITYLAVVLLVPQIYISQHEVQKLLLLITFSAVAVALCFTCFPKGDYIFYLTGVRGGIGPFFNRNHAAVFLALGALAALGLFVTAQLKCNRVMSSRQKNTFYLQQICVFVVFAGLCFAAIMTRSRGGILALLCGLFCYAVLCVLAVPHQLRKKLKGLLLTLIMLALSVGWVYTHVDDINLFANRSTGVSSQTRQMLYRSATRILAQRPVWGIGVGAMPVVITSYTEWPMKSYIERLHNDWLEILLGIGYGGAIFIVTGLLWFLFFVSKRLRRLEIRKQFLFAALLSALFAMSVASAVDFHFFIPANALVFFLLLGLVCAPTYAKHHIREINITVWLRLAVVLVLAASMYIPIQKTRAWRCVEFGRGLKTNAKLTQYERSVAYYPSPRYAVRLGNAYLNASYRAVTVEEKEAFRQKAFELSLIYLDKYPREKELSALYARSRPHS